MKGGRVSYGLWIVLAFFGLVGGLSCNPSNPNGVHYIIVGNYVFAFPVGFELDQEMQTITVGELEFHYYTGNLKNLHYSDTEFAFDQLWKNDAAVPYWNPKYEFPCLEVMRIRKSTVADRGFAEGYRYIAICRIDSMEFEHTIRPRNIDVSMNFKIDTLGDFMRKIYQPKAPAVRGLVGVYMREAYCDYRYTQCNASRIEVVVGNEAELQMALRIFETGRHVK
jgi:hypothetical protein